MLLESITSIRLKVEWAVWFAAIWCSSAISIREAVGFERNLIGVEFSLGVADAFSLDGQRWRKTKLRGFVRGPA